MTTKKLTLLLLPLVPLTAFGIVEVAGTSATPQQAYQGTPCWLPDSPHVAPEPVDPEPEPAPTPAPAPAPQTVPVA